MSISTFTLNEVEKPAMTVSYSMLVAPSSQAGLSAEYVLSAAEPFFSISLLSGRSVSLALLVGHKACSNTFVLEIVADNSSKAKLVPLGNDTASIRR